MFSSLRRVIPCGALLLAGCAGSGVEVPAAAARVVGDVFLTSNVMSAGGNGAGGLVRLIDLPATNDIQIQVELTGIPAGEHAWHIHSGTCGMPGAIVVPFTPVGQRAGIDEPITAASDGRAEEDALIPAAMLTREQVTASPHILNIHVYPGSNPGGSIACADLR